MIQKGRKPYPSHPSLLCNALKTRTLHTDSNKFDQLHGYSIIARLPDLKKEGFVHNPSLPPLQVEAGLWN